MSAAHHQHHRARQPPAPTNTVEHAADGRDTRRIEAGRCGVGDLPAQRVGNHRLQEGLVRRAATRRKGGVSGGGEAPRRPGRNRHPQPPRRPLPRLRRRRPHRPRRTRPRFRRACDAAGGACAARHRPRRQPSSPARSRRRDAGLRVHVSRRACRGALRRRRARTPPTSARAPGRPRPTSPRSRRKSRPARKRGCSTSVSGALPVRRSRRGCIIQISRMSAASRPRPEMSPMRASKTASMACCKAGKDGVAGRLLLLPAIEHVVPQHAGQHEARRDRLAFGDAPVGVGQRELHELLAAVVALRLVEGDVENREDAAVQALLPQLDDAGQRMPGLQQLDHLVEGARRRHVVEQRGQRLDRRARLRLDLEAELGREADHADDAHRVLAIARRRVADHAQQLLLRVLDAAVVVDDDLAHRVVVHRVDR